MYANPKSAKAAAQNIAEWLCQQSGLPRSAMRTTADLQGPRRFDHGPLVHDAKGFNDYVGDSENAGAGVAFEGGPDEWTYFHLPNAIYDGTVPMGRFFAEAHTSWAVAIYDGDIYWACKSPTAREANP